MKQKPKPISQKQMIIEQIALLLTSFVWTIVVLSPLVFFWIYQDLESNWNRISGLPESLEPAPALALAPEPTATPTPWPGPPPSPTPTETLIPISTATHVIAPPAILPETLNVDEPTPIPVLVHTQEEVGDYLPTPVPVEGVVPSATATLLIQITETPPPPPENLPPTPVETATSPPPTPTPLLPTPEPDIVPPAQPNPANMIPTRLVISSVDIDSKVIPVSWKLVEQNGNQYSIWEVADYAVGWHNTSALPGQSGNTVMAGHHNINGEVFKNLVNVEVGDEVIVYTGETPHRYQVELKTIVKEKGEPPEVRQKNAQWIAPTTDERLTLVTCWPYTNNTHRVIVVAKPAG
jgi:LPXTG-site transpeptidase (sortase) family protein